MQLSVFCKWDNGPETTSDLSNITQRFPLFSRVFLRPISSIVPTTFLKKKKKKKEAQE